VKVVTCFSYKGGSGRTVAANNIAAALASKASAGAIEKPLNFKVALFDLDVFSAGAHRVFDISNDVFQQGKTCIQDYLLNQIPPAEHAREGVFRFDDEVMQKGFGGWGAKGKCRADFTLFPAKPDPDRRFNVAKYHENLLLELILELEKQKFDYVILDGEAGIRAMADIALRLSDVVLMLFRLTWQHIEGTLKVAESLRELDSNRQVYLLASCVPLVDAQDGFYREGAPGLSELRTETERLPRISKLNDFCAENEAMGYLWTNNICIHDSLILKGAERVLVYDALIDNDRAASDYYRIAQVISERHKPNA
jgi:cellulose biosynthesis protein BcsQ